MVPGFRCSGVPREARSRLLTVVPLQDARIPRGLDGTHRGFIDRSFPHTTRRYVEVYSGVQVVRVM